ncbi:signal recognition particle protein [Sporolactobacillus laevolacticus]|uniref:Signal recognition particle protein n=1 Tax=Sporolactobacillus laevolacticus DSM 442 TaxID=1395513 RepID=V6J8H1_9BACL|nr:signal recognition particle protein [Sporolactobacillus laevolacticus]EST13089.1 signal recognition particle protein Srp54 [Sporolactobacillus laevolacticus DSM 442]MDN3954023.1 signal recognition particle protein [Sporolactobacillus laevolacticus]
MAFESLSDRLQATMKKIRGRGKVSEADVKEMTREIRLALLEADVNFKVVKSFVKRVQERAVGQEVLKSLTPGQQVIKVVQEELTDLMGGEQTKLNLALKPPTVLLFVGLQGAGKTTSAAKLANYIRKTHNKKPMMIAADIYRPAAIKQLQTLGGQLNIPVFSLGDQISPVEIVRQGMEQAKADHHDLILIDTAGRLHIDEALMDELDQIKSVSHPDEIFLVVDAMTGQDAVNVATSFNERLDLTGVIMTKLDGDTRGGAALSIRSVTGTPIKFVGMGEKMDALEPFHPDRMASRILGMGDVLSLIEKAQANIDEEKARDMQQKLLSVSFTLDDFLDQIGQIRNMGPLEDLLAMMPGANKFKGMKNMQIDEKKIGQTEAIIRSMTSQEKTDPDMINASRKKRIALGSGTSVADVNRLLKQFKDMKKMMKQFMGKAKGKKRNPFNLPFM